MPRETVTQTEIAEHVQRLGEFHPPINLDGVDFTVRALGTDEDHEAYAAEVGRVEAQLLWAHREGTTVPPYVIKALKDSVELYDARERRRGGEPR